MFNRRSILMLSN